jgi:hypothetical protein
MNTPRANSKPQKYRSSVILNLAADERLIAGDWRASDDLLAKARAVDPFRPFVYELMSGCTNPWVVW